MKHKCLASRANSRTASQRDSLSPQLPLCVGGTGQDRRLPGTVCAGSFGPQQQRGASRLRETCLDENPVTGRLRTTGHRKGQTGNMNAAMVYFLKVAVQPILLLGHCCITLHATLMPCPAFNYFCPHVVGIIQKVIFFIIPQPRFQYYPYRMSAGSVFVKINFRKKEIMISRPDCMCICLVIIQNCLVMLRVGVSVEIPTH